MRRALPPFSRLCLVALALSGCVDAFPTISTARLTSDAGVRDALTGLDDGLPDARIADRGLPDAAPPAETCNGLDDDGDGAFDEEVPIRPCPLQAGVCANARQPCLGAAGYGNCTYLEAMPPYEVDEATCDGADNDCDGEPDEGCACNAGDDRICGSDVGVCEPGRQLCGPDGQFAPCQNAIAPSDETCDGRDENCNGIIDDVASQECETGRPGRCAKGRTRCVEAETVCEAVEAPAAVDACTGEDDDCDGAVDEDATVQPCDTGQPGVCATGRQLCIMGMLRCNQITEPGAEIADGLDNDCDGRVDERPPFAFDLADLAVGGVGAVPGQPAQAIRLSADLEAGGFQTAPARYVDGAFSPSAIGLTPIDSSGTTFDFSPEVDEEQLGLVLAKGPIPPWADHPTLPDYSRDDRSILELRPNTGITFDLSTLATDNQAVPQRLLLRFGNINGEDITGMVIIDGVRRIAEAVPPGAEVAVEVRLGARTQRLALVIVGGLVDIDGGARTYLGDATVEFLGAD